MMMWDAPQEADRSFEPCFVVHRQTVYAELYISVRMPLEYVHFFHYSIYMYLSLCTWLRPFSHSP